MNNIKDIGQNNVVRHFEGLPVAAVEHMAGCARVSLLSMADTVMKYQAVSELASAEW